MHPAAAFEEHDQGRLERLVAQRGLAVIVGVDETGPVAAHAPVLLAAGRLRFHLSTANRLAAALRARPCALAVVTGPDAYVSPDWYGTPDQVPTWNYLSVEAEGPVREIGRAGLIELLDDLAAHFEAPLAPKPAWTRHKMAPARFEAMLGAIIGYEMRVERLSGVAKLSQNKPAGAIAAVAARLAERPDEASRAVAAAMGAFAPSP